MKIMHAVDMESQLISTTFQYNTAQLITQL